ncbi:MAG: hypothetical protein HYV27_10990 [Candidatus Hydrogenedentes bacterium]|nr:hypothetical protein [Candidatus Hydrogenedentota bacterium]
MAARHPERVKGAVFANTAILAPAKRIKATWFHRFSQMPIVSDIAFRGLGFPLPILSRVQGDPASIGAFERRAYAWPLARFADRAAPLGLARMVPNGPDHPSVHVLQTCERWATEFRGPVELVWGMRDPILGRSLKRIQAVFPEAPVTRTEAGHFLQEEVPDLLAAAILRVAQKV